MKRRTAAQRAASSASAYTRLGWKATYAGNASQATHYFALAERILARSRREQERRR